MTSDLVPDPWLILSSGPGAAAENMAWDEALLESCAALGSPVLRIYSWQEPAATFGYFQRFDEIARRTELRPLIRRPTGGGLVPHDKDWTYSVVVPPWHEWYSLKAEQSYARAHQWLQAALERVGLATLLASSSRRDESGQCFTGHEKNDVMNEGRKVAGAAQRRNKLGLLIQGSIQPPADNGSHRHAWEAAMLTSATTTFGAAWQPIVVPESVRQRVSELTTDKYGRDDYNQKR